MQQQEVVFIYRLGSLGDTLVAVPSFRLIRNAFPKARLVLITNLAVSEKVPTPRDILDGTGLIDDYFFYPLGLRGAGDAIELIRKLRAFKARTLVYLNPSRGRKGLIRDWLFFRLCGVRKMIGLPFARTLAKPQPDPATGDLEFEATRLVRSIRSLGTIDLDAQASWDLAARPEEIAAAAALLPARGATSRPIIAISCGTKMPSKDWGEENWTSLCNALGERYPDYLYVFIGAASERAMSDHASAGIASLSTNVCGQLSPRESFALLRNAVLFIGHDSGPMHLASAAGVPVVALFSARNLPRVWFPFGRQHRVIYKKVECAGCYLEVCPRADHLCMSLIGVEEVLGEIRLQLDKARPAAD